MRDYAIRRVILNIPVIFLVITFVFIAVRALPGDYAVAQLAQQFEQGGTSAEEALEATRARLGIDKPLPEQYGIYLKDIFTGDLGDSFVSKRSAFEEMKVRFPWTFQLAMMSIIVAVLTAVPVGVLSAIRQDTGLDYVLRFFSILALAIPGFFLATVLIGLVSRYQWWTIPLTSTDQALLWENPWASLRLFAIPAVVAGLAVGAPIMRILRAQMLEVMRQDYVRTAWAKGLGERRIIVRHVMKNAMIPALTVVGLSVGTLIGGQLVLEQIFNIPGIGRYIYTAIVQRDYPVVQAVVLMIATFIVFLNLVVDLAYALLDPRIKYS